jgi:tRNA-intron endonuclease
MEKLLDSSAAVHMQDLNELIETIYCDGNIIVPSQGEASTLQQKGYGIPRKKKPGITLLPYEALYLLEQNKIRIIDKQTKVELAFSELLGKYRATDPNIWIRYLIYRDLRDRGYVAKEGSGLGVNFQVHERGEYGLRDTKYVIFGISEGVQTPIDMLRNVLKSAQELKKELVLAVIDRRSEIIYYSFSELDLCRNT